MAILFRSLAAFGAIVAMLAACAWGADGRARFAEHAPANACFAVFSGDVAATCAAFQTTRVGKKLCGQEFAPLIAELARLELASPLHLRPVFGFDWNDLAKVHDAGGLAIFPLADGSQGAAWIFTPPEPIREAPACLTTAGLYFQEHGYRQTTAERKDVNVTVFHPPATRKGDAPRVLFAAATFYGIANSPAAADTLLALRPDQSLVGQAAFKQLLPAPTATDSSAVSEASLFVKPFELLDLLVRSADEARSKEAGATKAAQTKPERPKESEQTAARRLGLTAIESFTARVRFAAEPPCEWSITANLSALSPYRGALRIMELRPGPLAELPPWISADVITAGRWRWDFPLAMKGFGSLYDQANEPGPDGEGLFEDLLDGLRDDPEGVQVDLRRELFEQLSPDVLRTSDGGLQATNGQVESRRWLYVAGVRDVAKVKDALSRFYHSDKRVQHRAQADYDVWTVGEGSSLFVEGESDSVVTVRGLALGNGQLLFATDLDLLEKAIAGNSDGPKLRDDDSWTRLLEWTGRQRNEHTALESLARVDKILEPSYRAATSEPPADKSTGSVKGTPEKPVPLADRLWRVLLFGTAESTGGAARGAAPKFDALRDALPPGALVMSQTADGWLIRFGVLGSTQETSP